MNDRIAFATIATDAPWHPCAALARAVIAHALEDFALPECELFSGPRRNPQTRERVHHAVLAGEFLLEREDAVVAHWFAILGVDVARLRQARLRQTAWHAHLSMLRDRLAALSGPHRRLF